MSPQELLEAEISILLLRHGRKKLLQALAHRMQLSEEYLTSEISQLLRAEYATSTRKKTESEFFDVEKYIRDRPGVSESIRRIFSQYENRTFLPELRDVKRFFDRHGIKNPSIKSRLTARAPLIQLLLKLSEKELVQLSESAASDLAIDSSLGLISDEILGRNRTNSKSSGS